MVNTRHSLRQIFWLPAIIALVIAFGLVSALLGDGIWDAASWIALVFPLVIVSFFICRKAR
jgi:hypothetical protein